MSDELDPPTHVVSGVVEILSVQATMTATLRTRVNFAVQHMLAAARFARKAHEIEVAHVGEQFADFFDEIRHYVSATILFSVAALEANINEIFIDAADHFPEHSPDLMKAMWAAVAGQGKILEKYEIALLAKTGARLDKGETTCQDVASLIKLRNALVHAKPEWSDEQEEHEKIAGRLKGKFDLSPFLPVTAEFFPQKCMSYGCAKWAVTSSLGFAANFSREAGLTDRFAKHMAQLSLR